KWSLQRDQPDFQPGPSRGLLRLDQLHRPEYFHHCLHLRHETDGLLRQKGGTDRALSWVRNEKMGTRSPQLDQRRQAFTSGRECCLKSGASEWNGNHSYRDLLLVLVMGWTEPGQEPLRPCRKHFVDLYL